MSICTPQLLGSVCFRVWIDVMRDAQDGEVAYSKQSVYSSAPAVDGSVPMRIYFEICELCVVLPKKAAVQVALMSLDCFGIT